MPANLLDLLKIDPKGQAALRMAKEIRDSPQVWNFEDMEAGTLLARFTRSAGMRQVLAASDWNESLNIFTVLVVGRRSPQPPFNDGDKALLRLLMPHLQATLVRNVESHITSALVSRITGTMGLAIVDQGTCILKEEAFSQIVGAVWPKSAGTRIPRLIAEAIRVGKTVMSCDDFALHLVYGRDHVLLIATPPTTLHTLTHKELSIAADFARGNSYREVARRHGLPPETVRSRLRSVYAKLSISEKTELVRRLAHPNVLSNLPIEF